MTVFYSDDDDSDLERAGKQQRQLDIIRTSEKQEGPLPTEPTEFIDEPALLSEEVELARLRKSVRYLQYAAKKKTDLLDPPMVEKEVRPPEGSSKIFDVNIDMETTPVLNTETVRDPLVFSAQPSAQVLPDANSFARERPPTSSTIMKRQRPKIDPKIIDDSSGDDSSASDSSSSSEALLGPSLPAQSLRTDFNALLEALPVKNEATLGASHSSHISCISIDRAGARFLTGSIDSTVKLWDFNSMNRSLQPFKTVNPLGEGPVNTLQYAPIGGLLLCAGSGNTAVVMDRDGYVLSETAKGDMYIVDMAQTKGHTGSIMCAKWRPGNQWAGKFFATTAVDSTLRLWDVTRTAKVPMVDNPIVSQLRLTKLRSSKGGRASASAMDWTADGKQCVVACTDGKVKVIDPDAFSMRPADESCEVFSAGTEATCVVTAPETAASPLILVRSTDDCLRVFDRRKMATPLREFFSLPNAVAQTNACFVGESAAFFMTGTSANRKDKSTRGSLRMFETKTLCEVWKSEMVEMTGSVVYSTWHGMLNQIVYGCADGGIRVLYHPNESRKGILSCLSKSDYKKADGFVSLGVGEVFSGAALHEHAGRKGRLPAAEGSHVGGSHAVSKRRRIEASDAMKPKPFSGPKVKRGEASVSLSKHTSAAEVTQEWTRDPRAAILRYADVAKKDPIFTAAYRVTQPETMLAEKTAEQEEEDTRQAIYERDRLRKFKLKK